MEYFFRSLVLPVEMETEAPHSICRIAAVVLFVVLMTARELIQEDFLVLFKHYRAAVTKQDAERYWKINPLAPIGANI